MPVAPYLEGSMADTGAADASEHLRPEQVLHFRDGIPGFPEHHSFALVEIVPDGAFELLQSLDDPDMALVVCVPWLFFPDYAPELSPSDQAELGITSPHDAVVFCPVTLDQDEGVAYVNLLGPFIVNAATSQGRQVVLADPDQPTRAAVRLGA